MKKLLLTVVAVAVLGVGAYALFVTLYNPETQRAQLEQRLGEMFGRPAHVGPMRLTFAGGLGIEARNVVVERDPSFGEGSLLQVDRVWADIGVMDYVLRRQATIEKLVLESPKISVVKREDGVWNLSTLGVAPGVAPGVVAGVESSGSALPLIAAATVDIVPANAQMSVPPEKIEAKSAEITVVNRTVNPPTEVTYKGIELDAKIKPEDGHYRAGGAIRGNSEAAGGEPLAVDLPFDLALAPPGDGRTWTAQGRIPSGTFATRNLKLDSVVADVSLDEGQVFRLDNLDVALYGGALRGSTAVNLSTPANQFKVTGKLENVALGQALASRPDLGGTIQGQLTADFDGTGELGDFDWTIVSLAGTGHLAVDDARLTSTNVLAEITRQGGFKNISFDEPGTHADRVESAVRMGGGRLYLENATVYGVNGYADLRVPSGWIDLRKPATMEVAADAILLPALFQKVKSSGGIADVLISSVNGNSQVTVPLVVSGPIEKPTVAVRWSTVLKPYLPFGFVLP
jgi:hypothetical protein